MACHTLSLRGGLHDVLCTGLFAMDREYFFHLGAYDPEIKYCTPTPNVQQFWLSPACLQMVASTLICPSAPGCAVALWNGSLAQTVWPCHLMPACMVTCVHVTSLDVMQLDTFIASLTVLAWIPPLKSVALRLCVAYSTHLLGLEHQRWHLSGPKRYPRGRSLDGRVQSHLLRLPPPSRQAVW
jgi:hypothetical protein